MTNDSDAPPHFFRLLFPAMLMVLVIFRIGIFLSGGVIRRPFGVLLLGVYLLATIAAYVFR